MQELPDPVTKLTWDNAIYMGPALAEQQGLVSGDMVTLKTADGSIESAVMVMPGWADGTCSLSIGHGRSKSAGMIAPWRRFQRLSTQTHVRDGSRDEGLPRQDR